MGNCQPPELQSGPMPHCWGTWREMFVWRIVGRNDGKLKRRKCSVDYCRFSYSVLWGYEPWCLRETGRKMHSTETTSYRGGGRKDSSILVSKLLLNLGVRQLYITVGHPFKNILGEHKKWRIKMQEKEYCNKEELGHASNQSVSLNLQRWIMLWAYVGRKKIAILLLWEPTDVGSEKEKCHEIWNSHIVREKPMTAKSYTKHKYILLNTMRNFNEMRLNNFRN